MIVAHRRAGKTVACINELTIRALYTSKKRPQYAYVAPFYSQAKSVAWEYLKEATRPFIESAKDVRESELSVKLITGAKIRLYGADNIDAMRGIYLDGVVIDEFADCRPGLWGQVILPTLADRKGWATIIGTPKGKNAFYHMFEQAKANSKDWLALRLRASETGLIDPDELAAMRREMTDSEYEQEFECSFTAPVLGTYYAHLIEEGELNGAIYTNEGAARTLNKPVYCAADLGFTDSTAFWFWQENSNGTIKVIDYYEAHGKDLSHYINYLTSLPYDIETVWLPHDARAKTLQTGRSTIEQFLEAGFSARIVPNLGVQDGIEAARRLLPFCRFSDRTAEGVEALRAYRRRYDEQSKTYAKAPLHNWASNGADAFRYMSLVAGNKGRYNAPRSTIASARSQSYTLDALFAENEPTNTPNPVERLRI